MLRPCLDFLTAQELTALSCCSKWTRRSIEDATTARIKKIVGVSDWKLKIAKQNIVPYAQGKKEGVNKMKFCVTSNVDEKYEEQRVADLRKILRSKGLSQKGRKVELVRRLREHDATLTIPRTPRNLRYLWEREWLQPFYVDQWIDVKDTTENWLEAQIIDVNGSHVAIHYKGWKTKYDEWLDLSKGSPDWDRITRPLSRFHEHPKPYVHHSEFTNWLRTGFVHKFTEPVIMVHDTTEKWIEASVIGYRTWYPNCAQVRVTYHGWDRKYDEWIDVSSYRLKPHSFTRTENVAQPATVEMAEEGLATDDDRSVPAVATQRAVAARAGVPSTPTRNISSPPASLTRLTSQMAVTWS